MGYRSQLPAPARPRDRTRRNSERFAQSPNGAPKGALFAVRCVPPDKINLPPCSRPSRGFRGINGCPPRTAGGCRASRPRPRQRRARFPPFIPRPLDRRCAWRCSEGVGTGNVFRAGQFAAPCGGVEQGTWGRKRAKNAALTRLCPSSRFVSRPCGQSSRGVGLGEGLRTPSEHNSAVHHRRVDGL